MSLVCHCTLAGTKACFSCAEYIRHFGVPEQQDQWHYPEPKIWPKRDNGKEYELGGDKYRVVDGELFKLVEEAPPEKPPVDVTDKITKLTKILKDEMCDTCGGLHSKENMCLPHEGRTTGSQALHSRIAYLKSKLDEALKLLEEE